MTKQSNEAAVKAHIARGGMGKSCNKPDSQGRPCARPYWHAGACQGYDKVAREPNEAIEILREYVAAFHGYDDPPLVIRARAAIAKAESNN